MTLYIFIVCFMSRPRSMKSSTVLCYNINVLTCLCIPQPRRLLTLLLIVVVSVSWLNNRQCTTFTVISC